MEDLLPSQKLELEQIRSSSPLRDRLAWGESSGEFIGMNGVKVPCIRLRAGPPYLFSIARLPPAPRRGNLPGGADLHVLLRPANHRPSQIFHELDWTDVVNSFRGWLLFLERELKALSLWDNLVDHPVTTSDPLDQEWEDEPFGPAEILAIEAYLDEIEPEILDLVTESAAADEVAALREWAEGEFADLRAAAKTQNRKAWFRTFLGVGASFSMRFSDLWPKLAPWFQRLSDAIGQVIQNSGGILGP